MKNIFHAALSLTTFLILSFGAQSQNPILVKDINTVPQAAEFPKYMITFNGIVYFGMHQDAYSDELWRTDGTPEGTYMVKDINPGTMGSNPNNFIVFNQELFFSASGPAGSRLWKTDGTAEGTVVAADLDLDPLIVVNGKLLLKGFDGLWITDGTETGTTFLKDVQVDSQGPGSFAEINGVVYFRENGGLPFTEPNLWRTDGTVSGTYMVKALYDPNSSYNPFGMAAVNGTLFFVAESIAEGRELWKSDGTEAGTVIVKDIFPGNTSSFPKNLVAFNNKLYFFASAAVDQSYFWESNGTAAGTVPLKEVTPFVEPGSALGYEPPVIFNNALFFGGTGSDADGAELWTSDGTVAGTYILKNIIPGPDGSRPSRLTVTGDIIVFTTESGYEYWTGSDYGLAISDGTPQGTGIIYGSYHDRPEYFAAMGDRVVYAGVELGETSYKLAVSDGTYSGTQYIKPIITETSGSSQNYESLKAVTIGSETFFEATSSNSIYSNTLWKTDGTEAGTVMVKDIDPAGNYEIGNLCGLNGILYFAGVDSAHGQELWRSDGTEAGTFMVKDIQAGTSGGISNNITVMNGMLYFAGATSSTGSELWKSDGTDAGTVMVKNIAATFSSSMPSSLTAVNGILYFAATESVNGNELWKSDGTEAGTVLVKDINPGTASSNPLEFTVVNGVVYFVAENAATGKEVWRTDGTAAGTFLLKDVGSNSSPAELTASNNLLYFVHDNGGKGLYKSDGTEAGTVQIEAVDDDAYTPPIYLTDVNGILFFSAGNNNGDIELWKTDGTEAGTVRIEDISPDDRSEPHSFLAVQGVLYFAANDGINGNELWRSDGTICGTSRVSDIFPGQGEPDVCLLSSTGNTIYFIATDALHGRELWKVQHSTTPIDLIVSVPATSFCPGDQFNVDFVFGCKAKNSNVYSVQLSDGNGGFSNPTVIGTLPSADETGTIACTIPNTIPSGSKYRIRITATNEVATGIDNGADLTITCPAPQNVSASNITSSTAKIKWDAVDCAEKFQLKYKVQGTSSWTTVKPSTNSKKITGLAPNTSYDAKVRSTCAKSPNAYSSYSSVIHWTTSLKQSVDEEFLSAISIYPNPATDLITIQFTIPNSSDIEISLLDLQGRKIKTICEGNFEEGNHTLNFSVNDLAKGVFILQLKTNSEVKTQKVLVQ